jgi:hypothetical protein
MKKCLLFLRVLAFAADHRAADREATQAKPNASGAPQQAGKATSGSLSFDPPVNGHWAGKVSADKKTSAGTWNQASQNSPLPLNFSRQAQASSK